MIRVLRTLEYWFDTNEAAEQNMNNWAVPANGSIRWGKTTIKSSVIIDLAPFEIPKEVEPDASD